MCDVTFENTHKYTVMATPLNVCLWVLLKSAAQSIRLPTFGGGTQCLARSRDSAELRWAMLNSSAIFAFCCFEHWKIGWSRIGDCVDATPRIIVSMYLVCACANWTLPKVLPCLIRKMSLFGGLVTIHWAQLISLWFYFISVHST